MTDLTLAAGQGEPLHRDLLAALRQQFSGPADAILGHAELLLTAGRPASPHLADDLRRLRDSALKLKTVLSSAPALATAHPDAGEFRRILRHDLRTALSVVVGFGEMLLEDERCETARPGLVSLLEAAGSLMRLEALADTPALPPTVGLPDAPLRSSATPETEPGRLLLVDDTDETRALLARRLERDGHTVVEAVDGRSALARLGEQSFDLVLLDLVMPDLSGYEVLRRIKTHDRHRQIPVIVVSALDEVDSVVGCIEAGAEDYLTRPINTVLLRARIGASLEKRRLRARARALREEMQTSLVARDQRLAGAFAVQKAEIAQLQATIVSLREQLDERVRATAAAVDEARASATAEIHQLRAACAALRNRLEVQHAADTAAGQQVYDAAE